MVKTSSLFHPLRSIPGVNYLCEFYETVRHISRPKSIGVFLDPRCLSDEKKKKKKKGKKKEKKGGKREEKEKEKKRKKGKKKGGGERRKKMLV